MLNKEKSLRDLLAGHGAVDTRRLPRLKLEDIQNSPYLDHVQQVYRSLSGAQSMLPVNPRATWDIEFQGIAVELDEQLHFNRYRAITLSSPAYEELKSFPRINYRSFCTQFEEPCLRAGSHGKRWTNPSCEKQFGVSPPRGQLEGLGPARWRQRAFYDFLKDLSSLIIGQPVVRIAIWDQIQIGEKFETVEWILKNPSDEGNQEILKLVKERSSL